MGGGPDKEVSPIFSMTEGSGWPTLGHAWPIMSDIRAVEGGIEEIPASEIFKPIALLAAEQGPQFCASVNFFHD